MTNEQFDETLKALDIGTGEAAKEMASLGDSKTSASYVSAMRSGKKAVTQAAAIYVRLKKASHNGGPSLQEAVADELEKLVQSLRRG